MKKKKRIVTAGIILVVILICLAGVWLLGVHRGNFWVADIDRIDADRWVEDGDCAFAFTLERDVADLKLDFRGCEVYKGDVTITLENDAGEVVCTIDGRQQMEASDAGEQVMWLGSLKKGDYRFIAHVTEDAIFSIIISAEEYLHGYQFLF